VGGDELEPAEAAELDAALKIAANRDEAVAWLQFEAAVSEHLKSTAEAAADRSRERLLAKAILREKHRAVTRKISARTPFLYRLAPVAAAAALLAVGLFFFGGWPRDKHNQVLASGDFRVLRAEAVGYAQKSIERGDRLVTGAGEASLVLGEYCKFDLASNCDLTIRGEPGNERIELHRGRLHARVQPQHGAFVLVTPLGRIEVKGTEFVATVDHLDSTQGEHSMNDRTRRVVVSVAVLAGAVVCQLGDGPVVLQTGESRVFAGEREDARGVVAAKTDLTLTLELASGEKVLFHAPESKALTVREVSQLNVGDEAAVIWIEEEGKKWIQDIIAKGVIEGVVTGLGDIWIEVKPEGKKAVRLIPPWLEATANRDGGLDREVLRKLGQTRVGDRVLVNWEMPEGQRVMDLKVLQRGSREEGARDVPEGAIPVGLRGFKGILFGKIAEKNDEKGTFKLEVQKVGRAWRQNQAKNAEEAVGKSLPVELHHESRLFGQHQETLRKLNHGDVVEVELFHVKDGVLSVMELLRKAE